MLKMLLGRRPVRVGGTRKQKQGPLGAQRAVASPRGSATALGLVNS